jgi:DNA-binding SARP family transcriptional activator
VTGAAPSSRSADPPEGPVGPATEHLDFAVLGPLAVAGEQGPIAVDGVRRRAVLIRLLMERSQPVPLGRLIEDVWGGDPPPGAPSTLRSHLSLLRKALGANRIRSRNGAVTLELRPGEFDVTGFESEVKQAHTALADDQLRIAEVLFDHSLDWWRGPALIDVEGLPWALPEVGRLEEQRLGAVEGLLTAHLRLGESQRVVSEGEMAVRENPLREQRWSLLITALYRTGRQADALRAYQRLRAHLAEELGIEPSPGLQKLEHAVLSQDPSLEWQGGPHVPGEPSTSLPLPGPTVPGGSDRDVTPASGEESDLTWLPPSQLPPFVGRERAMETAMAARSRVHEERRQALVVITGEPGIGKTRLAAEIASSCAAHGDLVLYGRCDEEPLSPFQGFRQAFSRVVRYPGGQQALGDIGPLVGSLRQVVPDLAGSAPVTEHRTPAGAEAELFQSFEAVVSFVQAMADRRPLVLVLEDLQWADTPALSLLEHLLRAPMAAPVLIIGTYRNTQFDQKSWIAESLVGLRRTADVERVDLVGLSPTKSLTLFESAVGSAVGPGGADQLSLRAYTGGNPFFLQELASEMAAGTSSLELSLAPNMYRSSSVPERLRELVHWRLVKLSEPCKRVLSIASLMGLHFQVDILMASCDYDEAVVLAVLDEAQSAGVIVEVTEEADHYRFVHDLVRQTLDAELGSARRIRSHYRIAQVLEERFGTDTARLSEIALHYFHGIAAGSVERAVVYSRLAGEAALRNVSYDAAVQHLGRALAVSSVHTPDNSDGRCDLLLLLAEAQVKSGQLVEADETYAEAFERGVMLDRVDVMASAALGYGGILPAGVEPNARGQGFLRTVLTRLDPTAYRPRALALGRLAHWGHFSQPRPERRRLGDQAVEFAGMSGDPGTLATVLEYRYWSLCGPDEVDHQVASARRIQRIGRELDDPEVILRGLKCELHATFEGGDFSAADGLARRMADLAEQVKQPEYVRLGFMWDSLVAGIEGRFTDAERSATDAFTIFRQSGHSQVGAIGVGLSLTWLWLQGRMGELAPMLEAGQTGRSSTGEQALKAWVASEVGLLDTARSILAGLTPEMVAAEDRNFHWWFMMAGLSHASCNLGDERWAEALYEMIAPFAAHNCRVGQATFLGCAPYYLGSLALVAGRPKQAVDHLDQALVRHRAMHAAPFVELTKQALARAELGQVGVPAPLRSTAT